MKTPQVLLAAAVLLSLTAWAPEACASRVQISATKKTADSRRSSSQSLPRGSTHYKEKSVYYRFDIRSMSPDVTGATRIRWAVYVESQAGRLNQAASGEGSVELAFAQTATFDTDPVDLRERYWQNNRGSGKVADELEGYAVQLLTQEGKVIAEKFHPSSIEAQFHEDLEEEEARQARKDRQNKKEDELFEMLREQMKDRRPPRRRPRR